MYGSNSINMQAEYMSKDMKIPKIDINSDEDKLREQTDAFESIILKMLMDNAMKDEKNIFSSQNDPGDKIYKSCIEMNSQKRVQGALVFPKCCMIIYQEITPDLT